VATGFTACCHRPRSPAPPPSPRQEKARERQQRLYRHRLAAERQSVGDSDILALRPVVLGQLRNPRGRRWRGVGRECATLHHALDAKIPRADVLKDGRVIVTLNDARVVMRLLPARSQSSDAWFYAGGLMLEAATADGPIGETVAQLRRALRADGLL
jgi:hypothetical protein